MEQHEIIEMARQAGMVQDGDVWFSANNYEQSDVHTVELEAFAKLVAAKERDRMCEQCKWSKYENATCNEANQSKILGKGQQRGDKRMLGVD